uniref:Peptidase M13 N-terminal domain-containing protein n=1 Tax=Romanomermis culicivorax TaxID=13658 RepID=A0A915J927_ROMCU
SILGPTYRSLDSGSESYTVICYLRLCASNAGPTSWEGELLDNVSHTRHSSIDSARTFYRSCENETLIVKTWRRAFEESKNLLGGWPVLDKAWRPSFGDGSGVGVGDSGVVGVNGSLAVGGKAGRTTSKRGHRNAKGRRQKQQEILRNLFVKVAASPYDVLPAAGQNAISKLYGLLSLNFTQDSLFKFSVGADDKNSSSHIFQMTSVFVEVDQGTLTLLIRDFYLSPEGYEERDAYLDLMTECVLLLGADSRTARAEMAAVMQFETDLANITRDETRQDVESTYLKVTFLALRMEIPKFNWKIFMEALYPQHKFPHETPVVLYCADFLEDLSHLLVRYEER